MREQLLLLDDFSRNRTVMVASAFLMVGLGLKMALFPLHFWLPNAYAYAPSAVSALLAATATKVGVYMFFRFVFTVLDAGHRIYFVSIRDLIMICAGSGVLICSLMAIYQQNIKKMLAYSSVAQVGYIVLGLALNNEAGIAGSLVHVINHALIKGGMFMAVGAVTYRCGANMLSDFRGLGRQMPWTMAAFTAGGFVLIGFPLTAGFVSKWYLIRGAVEAGAWPVTVVILIGSLLAVIYVWRIIETIYFVAPENPERSVQEAPLSMLLPTLLVIAASLYFGFDAMLTGSLAEQAARVMLSGGLP
ncbi:MAG TPA: hypothetical protein EYG38_14145 [Verrucomicrobia bacterium]|nr:hypothetical protein [Verrucomicrobiota bacterium]